MRIIPVLALFLLFFTIPARAEDAPHAHIRLLPEHGVIKAGEEIWVAAEQSIDEGWHTYWKNPGDSGTSTRIKWTLPEGFTMSDIHWPLPHKIPYGPLTNYGYENNVILLQKLKAPDNLPAGPVNIKASIDVLVCKDICIPEYGDYEVTLNGTEAASEQNLPYFRNAADNLPLHVGWNASFTEQDGAFILAFPENSLGAVTNIEFFPEDWGFVDNAAKPEIANENGRTVLRQKRGDRALAEFPQTAGLVTFTENGVRKGYSFLAMKGPAAAPPSTAPSEPALSPAQTPNLFQVLVLALLGGLVLNLMPCVFPVLSIKALSLVKTAEKEPARARLHGIMYTLGVVLSFLAIAAVLIALKSAGNHIGWGFQLQNPAIVAILAYLLFVIGLNLSGVFEIGGGLGNVGGKLARGDSPEHSFFTGVLATLVATPCTAPFMAIALGYALVQPPVTGLAVFAVLGLGLALPYLALSIIPALQRLLPRPGAWMETFRQLLAFPMYASAAWLVWVISQQTGPMGVLSVLMGLVLLAFGVWLMRHTPKSRYWHYKIRVLAILALISAIVLLPVGKMPSAPGQPTTQEQQFGEAYSPEKLATLLTGDKPVFVEMTAAWCITCKLNHAVAINIESTRRIFAGQNVQYLVGDWTNQDAAITDYLMGFSRSGVPLYVYYGAPRDGKRPDPVVLPQILTPAIVQNVIQN